MNREKFLELVGDPYVADARAAQLESIARLRWDEGKHYLKQSRSELTPEQLQELERIEKLREDAFAWKNEAARRREIHKHGQSHLHPFWLRSVGLTVLADQLEALEVAYQAGREAVFGGYEVPANLDTATHDPSGFS